MPVSRTVLEDVYKRQEVEKETPKPILREQFEQYKPVVTAAISEDAAYRNACGHSDRDVYKRQVHSAP